MPQTSPQLTSISEVAAAAGIAADHVEPYGRHVAKIDLAARDVDHPHLGRHYVVVTAITPTPLGEGKTTTAVGLAQGLARLGHRPMLALRQPSMGPTFGIKGGASGAGRSQIIPMETLDLHLTGDLHAITSAHNLLAAMIDNHLHHGNELGIDPQTISWPRVVDLNDRALRHVVVGLGPKTDGVPRQSGFDITAASEVGVVLSLATSLRDLRARLGRIVVGYTWGGDPVTADDLKAAGAMTVILREAIKPTLMQTTEHTPVLVHTGPFGNIATGNSSIIADQVGMACSDYLVTEAGFGADMGLERLVNLKCQISGYRPAAAVVVATVRALKLHSGHHRVVAGKGLPPEMLEERPDEVRAGAVNLIKHVQIVQGFGITPVVAINVFPTDHRSELDEVRAVAAELGVACAESTHVVDGGEGALELARAVVEACEQPGEVRTSYEWVESLEHKLTAVATRVYGADGIDLSPQARRDLAHMADLGHGDLPVVIAKTHLSLSADPTRKGAPTGWRLPVREVRLAAGAGYVYAICGDMQTMPGLGRHPAAENIDIDDEGNIVGLF
ncbi:formate--tetrahydrofolate ligase [Aestuariimicrobium ganziense]|uniref:formate--tetrahydrofolate ligase n=1 Tax=Aestuariimicrobium ganziense TaxID=2773677 RepID=UPI002E2B8B8B|nr:formate--tetrahydrofolate ligase [Aestuariimicrobium ganziense]